MPGFGPPSRKRPRRRLNQRRGSCSEEAEVLNRKDFLVAGGQRRNRVIVQEPVGYSPSLDGNVILREYDTDDISHGSVVGVGVHE